VAVTTTATLTSAMQTYYDNRFLSYFKEKVVVMDQGQKRPVPLNSGKTIDFFRYHPYDLVTSSSTEGTVGTEVATLAMNFTATIVVWKNYTKISEFLQLTSRDRNLENIVDLMAQNAAESLDWQTQREIALYGATYIRGDCNATYQFEFTAGGDVSNSATTSISSSVFDTYCASNDVLIGSVVSFTRGYNYGQARVISDFAASGGKITWETAMPETFRAAGMDTGTKVVRGWFCEFRDSSATSTAPKSLKQGFQFRAVTKAVELLEKAGAPKFPDGYYHGVIDPVCKRQLLADSSVLTYMQNSRPAKLEKNQIGEIASVMWYSTTMPMRLEDEHGTSVTLSNSTFINKDAGKYYVTWVFGQNAFGVVELSGRRKKIIVKTPGPNSLSVPTDEYSTVGWKAYWICKALNSSYAVGIITYQA
jgi:hypothetical protein